MKIRAIFLFTVACIVTQSVVAQRKVYIAKLYAEDGVSAPTAYRDVMVVVLVKLYLRNLDDGKEQEVKDLTEFNMSAPADEGTVVRLDKNKFGLVPVRPKFSLTQTYQGKQLDTNMFDTKSIPSPRTLTLYYDDHSRMFSTGIPASASTIRIEPEYKDELKYFQQFYQKDANYFVTSFNLGIHNTSLPINGNSISLKQYKLKPGETFYVANIKMKRVTFRGDTVDVNTFRVESLKVPVK